jgi:hypothetical protein
MMIDGATGTMYQPGALTTTTWFIRCARREGCDTYWAESNMVKITVEDCCVDYEATLDKNMDWNCYSENDPDPAKQRTFLTAYPAGGTYEWSAGVTPVPGTNEGDITYAGTYYVTVTKDGCTDVAEVTVIEDKTEPNVSLHPADKLTCANNFEVTVSVNTGDFAVSDLNFTWTNATPDPQDPSKATVSSNTQINVSVEVQNKANGCVKTLNTSVQVDDHVQTPGLQKDGDLSCENEDVLITVQPQNYAYYVWTDSDDNTLQEGADKTTLTVTEAGMYTVVVTDAESGCTAEQTIEVTGECDPADSYECPEFADSGDNNERHVEWIDCYTVVVCTEKDLSNVRLDFGNPGFDGNDPNEGQIIEGQSGHRNVFTSDKPIIGVWVKAGSLKAGDDDPECNSEGCGPYIAAPENLNCDDLATPSSTGSRQKLNRNQSNQINNRINVQTPKVGIWPNPTVDGVLHLDMSDYKGRDALIQIFDMNGTIVHSEEFRNITSETYNVVMRNLDSGIYKLRAFIPGHPMTHTTFVVQNK